MGYLQRRMIVHPGTLLGFLETSPRNGLVPSPRQLVLEQEDHRDDHLIQLPLMQRYLFHPDLTFGPIDIKRKGIGESYFGEFYHIDK